MPLFGDVHREGVVLPGLLLGTSAAKSHFKDCGMGANCLVPFIVLCLWEGDGVDTTFVAKAFAHLRGHFGRG